MADQLWAMVGLAGATAPLAGLVAALVRYRRQRRAALVFHGRCAPRDHHLPATIEAAEGEIAVILRRMRAYLRDRYDYTASRIADEAAFETCLDRVTVLGAQIAELGGAAVDQTERERIRGLVLEGLLVSCHGSGRTGSPKTP